MKKWMMSALTALVFLAGLCLVACGGTTSWQVTFDADGGTATAAQSVEDGGTATEPADPEKEGFAFDGWFEEGAETPFDFATPITGDLTLTAGWTEEAQTSFTLADVDGIWTGSAKALGTLDVSFALTVDAENGAHAAVCYLSGSTSPLALTVESLAVADDRCGGGGQLV